MTPRQVLATPPLRRALLFGVFTLAGYLPLLVAVPQLVPGNPLVDSAALAEGYNNVAAYWAALGWSIACGALGAWLARRGWIGLESAPARHPGPPVGIPAGQRWLECLAVALLAIIAFFPPFLARHGPYIEDVVFVTAVHRMHAGQFPYEDFEFLYGPLMLAPLAWWTRLVGVSLSGYYTYLAIAEALGLVALLAVLQRFVAETGRRLFLFGLLAMLVFNPLAGLNYNAFRRLWPALALLLLTRAPADRRTVLGAGALLGIAVGYAHDLGGVSAVAAVTLYALLAARGDLPWRSALGHVTLLGVTAVAVWVGTTFVALRGAWVAYLLETADLVREFGRGEAGFRFYWTLNALALFALLTVALAIVATGVGRRARPATTWGDRFLWCALVAGVLALKSGLNRADVWHLDTGILPLALALVLPLPMAAFAPPRGLRRLGMGLLATVGLTYLLGAAPSAAYVADGWARGMREVLGGVPRAGVPYVPEAPAVMGEQTTPDSSLVALGAFLAAEPQRGRPVLFYGTACCIGPEIGVYKRDHLNDQFIYSERRGLAVQHLLARWPTGLVVMKDGEYRRLFGLPAPTVDEEIGGRMLRPSLIKRLGALLSTVHYHGVLVEARIHEERWRRTVGTYVQANFELAGAFGRYVVLSRRTSPRAARGNGAAATAPPASASPATPTRPTPPT